MSFDSHWWVSSVREEINGMDGQTDGLGKDGQFDVRSRDGRTNRWTDVWTDGQREQACKQDNSSGLRLGTGKAAPKRCSGTYGPTDRPTKHDVTLSLVHATKNDGINQKSTQKTYLTSLRCMIMGNCTISSLKARAGSRHQDGHTKPYHTNKPLALVSQPSASVQRFCRRWSLPFFGKRPR